MGLHKRVSDEAWTLEERLEVIDAFIERANGAMQGPLFDEKCFSDPNSGVGGFRLSLRIDKRTRESNWSIEYLKLDWGEYDCYIQQLRPFILSEQDVFLPKVTRHVEILLRDEYKECGVKLSDLIGRYISFEEPHYAPVHSRVYISNADGSDEIGASSADLALCYIYGRSVKSDIDRRRLIKRFEEDGGGDIAMALNGFLQQLMKLVYIVRREIINWNERDLFKCRLLTGAEG